MREKETGGKHSSNKSGNNKAAEAKLKTNCAKQATAKIKQELTNSKTPTANIEHLTSKLNTETKGKQT